MQIKYGISLSIQILAPLPLPVGLFFFSGILGSLLGPSILLKVLSVATSCLLFAAGIRNRPSEPDQASGGSIAALGMVGSLGLFLFGSLAGSTIVHWVALLALYDSMVLYLGGVGPLRIVLPASIALMALGFPDVTALDILAIVALTGANVYSVVSLLTKENTASAVAQLESNHSVHGSGTHCLLCGVKLSEAKPDTGAGRIAKIGAVSVLLLVVSAVPVQIVSARGGTPYLSNYSISGPASTYPLAYTHGWNITKMQSTVQGGLSFSRLVLSQGGRIVVVVTASSPSDLGALRATSNAYPNAVQSGTVSFGGSIPVKLFTESTNGSFRGMGWASTIEIFNGTIVQPVTISYLAIESLSSSAINGTGLYSATAASLGNFGAAQRWELFTSKGVVAWQAFGSYIAMAGAIFLIALPFESARRQDIRRVRSYENLLGLSEEGLTLLALLSSSRTPKTGYELMKDFGEEAGITDKKSFAELLVRMEELGLVGRVTKRGARGSILLWKSNVRV